MLGMDMDKFSHAIYRMAIHLENRQPVFYHNDDQDIQRALLRAQRHDTMLTGWFRINAFNEEIPEAEGGPNLELRNTLYADFGLDYVWRNYEWTRRDRAQRVITRLYSISPRQSELYHLRLLLLNVPGATSFQHLRTVNGVPYDTFTAAARALNLVENGQQWYDSMAEAAQYQMPYQLR
jgi:hypothetical protein